MADDQAKPDDHGELEDTDGMAGALEQALAGQSDVKYVLNLYVTGMRPRSQRAIENIHRLCEEHLPGRYELKIIDIYQQPELAQSDQIIAAPTLVKKLPEPLRRILGDLSDEGRVLVAMGVKVPDKPAQPTEPSPNDPA
jgi:circadian clock protein KaiB